MTKLDLEELERLVLAEVESYRNEVPQDALGRPFSDEKVERLLAELKAALVKPEWRTVRMRDTPEQNERQPQESRLCVLVADDTELYELYYDPSNDDFFLAMGDPPETIGVRGDAVGCFMAR